MASLHIFALLTIFILGGCYFLVGLLRKSNIKHVVFVLFGLGLVLRLGLAYFNMGFPNDTACFSGWADRMFEVGPGGFYSPNEFTDYPPGFMYVLWVIGAIRNLFQLTHYTGAHLLLLKLPAILCDLACGYLLYREAAKRTSDSSAAFLAAAYLFNPAILLNSSVWGQVDSVYTLAVILLCLFLIKGRMLPAYITFGVGILLKPQMLVFTPVLLAGILDHVFLKDFNWKKFSQNLVQGICVIAGMLLLCLPFGLSNIIAQYGSTLGSYPYASVNAYNFWSSIGLNWASQDGKLLFLSYQNWGILVIILIVLFTFIISLRAGAHPAKYPMLAAFIIITMFVFSVRMHERYMYPGLLLLLLSYLYKPTKSTYLCYGAFSILHWYNTAHVLYMYDPYNYDGKAPVIILTSIGTVLAAIYLYGIIGTHFMRKLSPCKDAAGKMIAANSNPCIDDSGDTLETLPALQEHLGFYQENTDPTGHSFLGIQLIRPKAPRASAEKVSFSRLDFILLACIMLLYSGFALYDLGYKDAPITTYDLAQNDSITLDFGEGSSPTALSYYIAPWQDRVFTLEGKAQETDDWQYLGDITLETVFTWKEISLPYNDIRYVRLTLRETQASVIELVFTASDGSQLVPLNAQDYTALFDESSLLPERSTFRDSMYFDEIYHARTAYEFINGLTTYETTHPPLGKIFIALGVALFGMNPFGWRIIGTLFGIAMLPFLYLFGKKLTANTPAAALSCFLFAFDFMHFTQTRIATIDVYITFFVILMYYFMFQYYNMSFYDTPLKRTLLPLGACGVAMGLGFASKWTGAYAGAGLALIFFATLYRRYQEYLYAKSAPKESTNGISHAGIIANFIPYTQRTIGFCMLFFVVIPIIIYVLSYLPFVGYSDAGLIQRMLDNQVSMFDYHSDLEATHYFASPWQEWPIMLRPIWYYSGIVTETAELHIREGISAFGNPLVWWMGIPAFLYMVFLALKKKDRIAAFLIVGYLAQYLPWFFVTRITFIYHYFPSVAFVVLMLVYSFMQLKKRLSNRSFILCLTLYGIAAFGLFLLFYPVLSGQPIDAEFVDKYLRWRDTWVLISY